MKKIKVEICCGTACYLLGAGKLLDIESVMPADWLEKVDISAWPCLNLCESEDLGGAPYARIDGKIVPRATVEKVCGIIESLLKGV